MSGIDDVFTDREQGLAAVARLTASGSRLKVLAVYGVSGSGKTAFLSYVRGQAVRGFPRVMVDVQDLVDGFSYLPEAGEDLALGVLREIGMALADCAPWWRRRRLRRLAARIGYSPSRGARIGQVALWNSTISESPVMTIGDDSIPESARRSLWVEGLVAVAAAIRRRQCLLLVDSTEWLYFFDDVRRERRRPGESLGVGAWFASDVLVRLLHAAPRLKVVLAGQDRLALERISGSARNTCELKGWDEGQTASYLARMGLPDRDLAALVQQECGGMPLLAWLLAQACLGWLEDGSAVTAAWLADQARDRPLREWFPEHVLGRLSREQREIIQACAVLRTATEAAIEAVIGRTDLSQGWAGTLHRHYLLEEVPAAGRALRWRMHPIVRSWLLAYQAQQDAERLPGQRVLPHWHQRAAEYYTQLSGGAFTAEAAYHSFASGNPELAAHWRKLMIEALHDGNFDQALVLSEAATSPGLANMLPAVHAAGAHARAYVAYRQGRFAAAAGHARGAAISYPAAADPHGYAQLLQLTGQIAWRQWDLQLARRSWQQALDLPGGVTHPGDQAVTVIALTEVTLNCGDAITAAALIFQARHLIIIAGESATPGKDIEATAALPSVGLASAMPTSHYDAQLLSMSARAAFLQGDRDQIDVYLVAAELAVRKNGDPHLLADVLCMRGRLSADRWDLSAGSSLLEAAMNMARDCPDPSCRVRVLIAIGVLHAHKAISGPSSPVASLAEVETAAGTDGLNISAISLNQMAEARHEWQLAIEFISAAIDVAEQADDRGDKADAYRRLSEIALMRGDYDAASQHFSRALGIYQQTGNRAGEARAHGGLGEVARMRSDYDDAGQHYSQALSIYQQTGDRDGETLACQGLGDIARMRGDYDDAGRHYSRSLAIDNQNGNPTGEARAHGGLGEVARMRSDYDDAGQHYSQALSIYQQTGDRDGEASAHQGLGAVALMRGDYDDAGRRYSRALGIYQQIGDRDGEADAHRGLGEIARMRGNYDDADRHFSRALGICQQIGDRDGEANAHRGLGEIARMRGNYDDADRRYSRALGICQQIGDRDGEADAHRGLGEIARMRGNYDDAGRHFSRALGIYQQTGDRGGEALARQRLAEAESLRRNSLRQR